jgi:hypothetical protein
MTDEKTYKILVMKPERKRSLECLSAEEKIILIWILKKQDVKMWTGFS